MSPTKVILILAATGILLFVLLLYITLSDSVDDVSDETPYKDLVDRNLSFSRDMLLVENEPNLSQFEPNFFLEAFDRLPQGTTLLQKLPQGTKFVIRKFKSVQNGTSGTTTWYAIGKVTIQEPKSEIPFEYAWPRDYSFLESKYREHGTPPWRQCPFDEDIQTQSVKELGKMFKDVVWEQSQGKAIANLSDTQTLKVSMGGCLRCNWAVSFETSESIGLEDLNFWNKTTNWIFEKVFTDEKDRFTDVLANKKVEYDSSLSDVHKRVYTFIEPQSDSPNNYLGIEISENERAKKLEVKWYRDEPLH